MVWLLADICDTLQTVSSLLFEIYSLFELTPCGRSLRLCLVRISIPSQGDYIIKSNTLPDLILCLAIEARVRVVPQQRTRERHL